MRRLLPIVALVLFAAPGTAAAFPESNGDIVFTSDRDGDTELYLLTSEHDGVRRVTRSHTASVRGGDFSPQVYLMRPDGRGLRRLTSIRDGENSAPAWSPDGTRIAFSSNRDGLQEIYVMRADGSHETRLTANRRDDTFPRWSPDGSAIVFTADTGPRSSSLFTIAADGSAQRRLTRGAHRDFFADWQPLPTDPATSAADRSWRVVGSPNPGAVDTTCPVPQPSPPLMRGRWGTTWSRRALSPRPSRSTGTAASGRSSRARTWAGTASCRRSTRPRPPMSGPWDGGSRMAPARPAAVPSSNTGTGPRGGWRRARTRGSRVETGVCAACWRSPPRMCGRSAATTPRGAPTLQPLIEHWDGNTWEVVPGPRRSPGPWSELKAISGTGPSDIWAVGIRDAQVGSIITERALILHWDGLRWRRVRTPVPSGRDPFGLRDVVALSPTNAWAVGAVADRRRHRTVIMHWDGRSWGLVSSADPSAQFQDLAAVAAASARRLWAVGTYYDGAARQLRALVERWTGTHWRKVPSGNRRSRELKLHDIAVVPGAQFAVGTSFANGYERTLIVQRCRCKPPGAPD